ncbi:NAD-dependent 4,6-dehydratase LegB [Prochlorococcus sp. AH-716-E13]|nr:NAD-dependent 4,6-dehydratase LegB [Prochlorococcus sp. AH-716-E13]
MKKLLVTGADGFIGSHLVELLVERGFDVTAFCIYNSNGNWGWLENISPDKKKEIKVILGDVRDPLCVKQAMKGCDTVFHLAALIAIPYSYIAPSSYVDTNIHGTLNVLQAARELNISKLIHTSTSETYGSAQFVPITEDHPLVGQSPYSASKIAADQMAISYWKSFELPVTILRPFNTYGPRQSNRAVIPQVITQIAKGENQIKLGALTPTRDFNFVTDTCEAFFSVAKSGKTVGEIINAASNFEISIEKTAILISELMNRSIEIVSEEKRKRPSDSEVNRLFGCNKKIFSLTDWRQNYSGYEGFKKGLKLTIDWFTNSKNLSLYRSDYVV